MPHKIEKIKSYVQQQLNGVESGHGYWHAIRVYNNTRRIAQTESCHLPVAEAAALLHDLLDPKLFPRSTDSQQHQMQQLLTALNYSEADIHHVAQIITHMSFRNSFDAQTFYSKELQVVQDADRLDAIGAIGIARTFSYGGHKNREIHDPQIAPHTYSSKADYANATAPTLNHFHEKLLKLKDMMNTDTARHIAAARHRFMEEYLNQFYAEWNGEK